MRRPPGRLRIIGGEWRSRVLDFDAGSETKPGAGAGARRGAAAGAALGAAPGDGVRPTPDRVRQTVFDWLAPWVEGSRCLDLFAGSGALGFEALSRGAASAVFVERGAAQAQAIRDAAQRLGAQARAQVVQDDALAWLQRDAGRYDLVFLDPPYDAGLLTPVLAALPAHLAPVHRIYLEWRRGQEAPLPPGYRLLKERTAGQVSYGLAVAPGAGSPANTSA